MASGPSRVDDPGMVVVDTHPEIVVALQFVVLTSVNVSEL
jgi:hypothetical protein